MTSNRTSTLSACLFAAIAFAGCGGGSTDGPTMIPVTGTVSINGTPLDDGVIAFVKGDGQEQFIANVVNGQYQAKANVDAKGIPAGEYQVCVRTFDAGMKMAEKGEKFKAAKTSVPEKYTDFKKSGLTASVTDKTPKHDFDLK
ncbi:hypothetical protein SH668x_001517 [Planctomicrobium sp. SH668]|uniref:hypothetical protein n=1 Tax=Planctomicrobium sp. SH668 TaxID=3448126 RepID=UPI003F5B27E4